ncbi:MAG: TSUP family transporter [Pseudomonadota bacterium]|nr:TSUP family transporter [Pseudomonadota bacterium]
MDVIPGASLLLALAAVALAGLVHGTLGIGFPMVATPLIALGTDVRTAILLTLAPTLAVNILSILRGGRWRESLGRHWPVAVFVLIGSVAGTRLLIGVDPAPFKLLLAAMIGVYLATSAHPRQEWWGWIGRCRRLAAAGFGLAAGLLAGVVNVAVPVLIIYFSELQLAPLALVQILNLCFMAGKIAQAGTFALTGHLSAAILLWSLPLAAMAVAALWAGMALRQRVDAGTYRRWLRRGLLVIAGLLVLQFAAALASSPTAAG